MERNPMHAHERGVLGHKQAHRVLLGVTLPFLAVAFHSTPVSAQPPSGGFASVVVPPASFEDGTSVAVTGGLGYRLTRSLTLGIELTSVPSLDPDVPSVPSIPVIQASGPIVYPVPPPIVSYEAEGGHAVVFTANLRLDVPTQRRVAPYFVGGAGVGSITDRFQVTTSYPSIVFPTPQGPPILPDVAPGSAHFSSSSGPINLSYLDRLCRDDWRGRHDPYRAASSLRRRCALSRFARG